MLNRETILYVQRNLKAIAQDKLRCGIYDTFNQQLVEKRNALTGHLKETIYDKVVLDTALEALKEKVSEFKHNLVQAHKKNNLPAQTVKDIHVTFAAFNFVTFIQERASVQQAVQEVQQAATEVEDILAEGIVEESVEDTLEKSEEESIEESNTVKFTQLQQNHTDLQKNHAELKETYSALHQSYQDATKLIERHQNEFARLQDLNNQSQLQKTEADLKIKSQNEIITNQAKELRARGKKISEQATQLKTQSDQLAKHQDHIRVNSRLITEQSEQLENLKAENKKQIKTLSEKNNEVTNLLEKNSLLLQELENLKEANKISQSQVEGHDKTIDNLCTLIEQSEAHLKKSKAKPTVSILSKAWGVLSSTIHFPFTLLTSFIPEQNPVTTMVNGGRDGASKLRSYIPAQSTFLGWGFSRKPVDAPKPEVEKENDLVAKNASDVKKTPRPIVAL